MRTDFSNLRETLANFLNAVEQTSSDLIEKANEHRTTLLNLYAEIRDNREDIVEFGEIMDEASVVLGEIGDLHTDIAYKIDAVLTDGADIVPECNYEDFVDYCVECGKVITDEDGAGYNEDGFICADCLIVDEPETAEPEQLTIDIPAETADTDTDTAGNPIEYVG